MLNTQWMAGKVSCAVLSGLILMLGMIVARPAAATIAFVQEAGLNPNTGSPVSVTFTAAQTAGNFNVVTVAWDDTTSTVLSITDTKGNTYVQAGTSTTISGIVTQQVYYATNIAAAAAGANTVTVVYSKSVTYPEVKITEYSGISTTSPFDGMASGTGTGTAIITKSLTTTNANDLLLATDVVYGTSTAGDPNYTSRDTVGGDLEQDRIVSAVGTYTASDTQTPSSWWLIQLVAFKAAAAPTISSFTPTSGPVGTLITITGTNLSGATSSGWIGSAHDAAVANVSSTTVTMTVPNDAPVAADQLTVFTGGGTAFSGTNFTVTSGGTPPAPPTNLANSAISSSQINLTWTASTGATGYVIQRCAGASCTSFAQIGTSTTTSYSDTGLTASTSYTYRIDATNAAGSSGFSNTTTGTTTAAGSPLSAPTNLANSVISSSQINLTWIASTGATGYVIQRCAGASCTSFVQIGTSTTTSYSDTGLTASTSYTYRVDATNTAGSSGFSNTTTGTTTAALPTAPSNLANSVISSSQINLTWTASTGATGYVVQRCTGTSCTSFAQIGTSTTTSYSDTGLTASTSYTYRVYATNTAGSSGFSNTTSGTTTATAPTSPPVITSPATGTTVLAGQSLTISANVLAGEFPSGVALLAQDPLGSAPIQTVSGSTVTFSIAIPPNTPSGTYLITVLGVNSAGAVIPSAQLSVDVEQANQASVISAYPSAITMASVGDIRSLTVLGSFPSNLQIDISKSSQLTSVSENSAIATIQNGTITGVSSGQTNIDISYGLLTLTVPVTVQ